jgi:arylformamidase
MTTAKLWDISPPIAPDSPLFPGDTGYSQQWTAQIGPGCPVNLSAITMSPHIGAHADAPAHLAHALDRLPPRVLVRTCRKAPTQWSPAFSAFAPETIAWLASLGVRLVGIDSQSVDPAESKTLESHALLLRHDLRVLENLVLDEVPAGDYELIALPLKLTLADASPVRAILRELP